MRREFSAGFIIFKRTRQGIRYLLLYHGGAYWNFPKGHIEKNESDLKAALREVREETGLKRLKVVPGFKRYEKYFFRKAGEKKGARFKLVVYFLAEVKPDERVVISHEHEAFGWFAFADALKTVRYQESKRLLSGAQQFLKIGMNPDAQRIYLLTGKIPKGKVSTYGALAAAIGKPNAGRFVGFVLNKNTDLAIPCHRVVASDGTLGGYNKGVTRKTALLKKEGVEIAGNCINLLRFGFHIRL